MDIFELTRKFRELEDRVKDLENMVRNMDVNKADKVHYPQYSPVEWPPTPTWVPHPAFQYPNITCSTGEKV